MKRNFRQRSTVSSDSSNKQFIGRRTGKVFEIESYDELLSDSEADATLDITKKEALDVRSDSKRRSIVASKTKDGSFQHPLPTRQKSNAAVPKKLARSRFGRRTGKDLFAGKKKLQENGGLENFSDFFSDTDDSISLHPTPDRTVSSSSLLSCENSGASHKYLRPSKSRTSLLHKSPPVMSVRAEFLQPNKENDSLTVDELERSHTSSSRLSDLRGYKKNLSVLSMTDEDFNSLIESASKSGTNNEESRNRSVQKERKNITEKELNSATTRPNASLNKSRNRSFHREVMNQSEKELNSTGVNPIKSLRNRSHQREIIDLTGRELDPSVLNSSKSLNKSRNRSVHRGIDLTGRELDSPVPNSSKSLNKSRNRSVHRGIDLTGRELDSPVPNSSKSLNKSRNRSVQREIDLTGRKLDSTMPNSSKSLNKSRNRSVHREIEDLTGRELDSPVPSSSKSLNKSRNRSVQREIEDLTGRELDSSVPSSSKSLTKSRNRSVERECGDLTGKELNSMSGYPDKSLSKSRYESLQGESTSLTEKESDSSKSTYQKSLEKSRHSPFQGRLSELKILPKESDGMSSDVLNEVDSYSEDHHVGSDDNPHLSLPNFATVEEACPGKENHKPVPSDGGKAEGDIEVQQRMVSDLSAFTRGSDVMKGQEVAAVAGQLEQVGNSHESRLGGNHGNTDKQFSVLSETTTNYRDEIQPNKMTPVEASAPSTSHDRPVLDFGGTTTGSVSNTDKVLPNHFFGIKKRLTFCKGLGDVRNSTSAIGSSNASFKQRNSHPGSFVDHHSKSTIDCPVSAEPHIDPNVSSDSVSDGFRIVNSQEVVPNVSKIEDDFVTLTGTRRSIDKRGRRMGDKEKNRKFSPNHNKSLTTSEKDPVKESSAKDKSFATDDKNRHRTTRGQLLNSNLYVSDDSEDADDDHISRGSVKKSEIPVKKKHAARQQERKDKIIADAVEKKIVNNKEEQIDLHLSDSDCNTNASKNIKIGDDEEKRRASRVGGRKYRSRSRSVVTNEYDENVCVVENDTPQVVEIESPQRRMLSPLSHSHVKGDDWELEGQGVAMEDNEKTNKKGVKQASKASSSVRRLRSKRGNKGGKGVTDEEKIHDQQEGGFDVVEEEGVPITSPITTKTREENSISTDHSSSSSAVAKIKKNRKKNVSVQEDEEEIGSSDIPPIEKKRRLTACTELIIQEDDVESDLGDKKSKKSLKKTKLKRSKRSIGTEHKKRSLTQSSGRRKLSKRQTKEIRKEISTPVSHLHPMSMLPRITPKSGVSFRRKSSFVSSLLSSEQSQDEQEYEPDKKTNERYEMTPKISRKSKSNSLRKRAILESARSKGLRAVLGTTPAPLSFEPDNSPLLVCSPFAANGCDSSTILPSPSSSPVHYAQTTMTDRRQSDVLTLPDLSYKIIHPEDNDSGLRRSKRTRVQRLRDYKGEGIVYRRDRAGFLVVHSIMPSMGEAKLLALERKRNKRKAKKRKEAKAVPAKARRMSAHCPIREQDLTDSAEISVINPDTEQRVVIELVSHSKEAEWFGPDLSHSSQRDSFGMSVRLNQPAFCTGELHIRPMCEKPRQITQETLVYFLIHGTISVSINNSTFLVENRDHFFIPRGSTYKIKNLRRDIAQLKFLSLRDDVGGKSDVRTSSEELLF